jgi:putative tryptophan/tyrosine transport system substrate-binding protein
LFGELPWGRAIIMPVPKKIGVLYSGTKKSLRKQLDALLEGLKEEDPGFVPGKKIKIIGPRYADDDYQTKLPKHAKDLIETEKVAVLVAAGGPVSALAAQNATTKIPIVFTSVANPVGHGLVSTVRSPGGNLTGVMGLTTEKDLDRLKWLQLFNPAASKIGVLVNPNRPNVKQETKQLLAAADNKLQLLVEEAGAVGQIKTAIKKLATQKVGALLVTADPFFNSERRAVIQEVARYGLPAIYQWREFVDEGGLMSYGPSLNEEYRNAGKYAGRILKGENPAKMALYEPTTFELVINSSTARALRLTVPPR